MHSQSIQKGSDPKHRRPVLNVTLACLGILLLAQMLIGALSLSALNKLMVDTTADRVEVMARGAAGRIDTGLRLGKPLAQYFGLDPILHDILTRADDVRGAAVVLVNGQLIAEVGAIGPDAAMLARGFIPGPPGSGITQRLSGALMAINGETVTIAVPLKAANGQVLGAVALSVAKDEKVTYRLISKNLQVLFIVTLVVGVCLSALIKYLLPRGFFAAGQRLGFVVPLLALLLAQGVYATYTISTFRSTWLEVTRSNVSLIAQGLQRDLDRVLGYGISVPQLKNVEAPFSRLAATFPTVAYVELIDQAGKLLVRVDARQTLPVPDPFERTRIEDDLTLRLPLGVGLTDQAAQGTLILRLDAAVIAAGVRSRMLDAVTVVGVALVAAIEMLLLLSLVLDRSLSSPQALLSRAGPTYTDAQQELQIGRVARPIMFSFLFAWALPMGFLPLYARTLPTWGVNWPPALLLALPISVEMGCGLVASLMAGRLTDRRGWQVPVLAGLGVASAGVLACVVASDLWLFVAARGLVGLGYGLTWMGLQGFIVTRSPAHYSGRNMTSVIAGLFAGHLSGVAVGAMLVDQIGFRLVFAVGAVILVVPLVGVLTLMRPYMDRGLKIAMPTVTRTRTHLADAMHLFFSRGFGLLLIGSVIPFSIAQVGLLSFALPLYLEAKGAGNASTGRVLMIYGLCVIYVGPVMGRLLDRSRAKKTWIVVGGLVGSAGMLLLYYLSGLPAAATAVFMLALASCFTGASQSPYMLSLPSVQRYGAAAATSIMRAADKLGQMVGPLVVGAMFGSFGMTTGLAATGVLYLVATLIFLTFGASLATSYKRT
jgi:predicted MFS family arabinose efflux permease